jgi:hypothetical protein
MKIKVLLGFVVCALFVLCIQVPVHAAGVEIRNYCGQSVNYRLFNNFWFGTWSIVQNGTMAPGSSTYGSTSSLSSCVVNVHLNWNKTETYSGGKWTRGNYPYDSFDQDCVINGCPWLQCGSATYSLDPEGTPSVPHEGDTRKCVLTKK